VSSTDGRALVTRTVVQNRESTAEFVDAYRKTVMGVDHYESHYGESVGENMAMELGAEIATAIRANAELNPLLNRKLQVAIDEAIQRRSRLLDDERIYLRTVLEDYRRVERRIDEMPDCRASAAPFEELKRHWNRLSDLEERCEQSIRSQQQCITERQTSVLELDDHVIFNGYLYETLESGFRSSRQVSNCSIESIVTDSSGAPAVRVQGNEARTETEHRSVVENRGSDHASRWFGSGKSTIRSLLWGYKAVGVRLLTPFRYADSKALITSITVCSREHQLRRVARHVPSVYPRSVLSDHPEFG